MPTLPRSSPEGATTEWTVTAPADEAYYSFIDPGGWKAELAEYFCQSGVKKISYWLSPVSTCSDCRAYGPSSTASVLFLSHACPSAWNADIRATSDAVVFWRQFKTHYFSLDFNILILCFFLTYGMHLRSRCRPTRYKYSWWWWWWWWLQGPMRGSPSLWRGEACPNHASVFLAICFHYVCA